jgi:hypothetical protein
VACSAGAGRGEGGVTELRQRQRQEGRVHAGGGRSGHDQADPVGG